MNILYFWLYLQKRIMMWYKKRTIETNATKEQVWKLWTNVENWNNWDNQVEFSKLNGDFEKGTYGILKPIKSPKSKFQLILVDDLRAFTTRSCLPLTKLDFTHGLNEKDGKLYITHGVKITGVLTFLFSKVIGEKIIKELPHAMEKLSKMAEESEL